jgi:hypothetical protein
MSLCDDDVKWEREREREREREILEWHKSDWEVSNRLGMFAIYFPPMHTIARTK